MFRSIRTSSESFSRKKQGNNCIEEFLVSELEMIAIPFNILNLTGFSEVS